jgi:hypothetical protein
MAAAAASTAVKLGTDARLLGQRLASHALAVGSPVLCENGGKLPEQDLDLKWLGDTGDTAGRVRPHNRILRVRPKWTAAITSATSVQRALKSDHLSIMPLYSAWASP